MKLSVVIVSYNVKYYLEQCLVALERALIDINADIYIVDNNSSDNSATYITSRFPNINFISSKKNNGFSYANNIAIKQSNGEYVLLLNPDTIVGERSLKDTILFMDEHKHAGALGVRMLNSDGVSAMESRRGLPTPLTAFYKFCGLCAKFPHSQRFAKYYMGDLTWNKPARIEVISGAFFMIRRKALDKIGLLDEDFFMYAEDIDLSYRLLNGGFENWYLPVKILHYKGESTKKTSFKYAYVFYKAMLIFISKHYHNTDILLHVPMKLAIYAKTMLTMISISLKKMKLLKSCNDCAYKKFVFFGYTDAINVCKDIAMRNNLDAQFIVGNHVSLPTGYAGMKDVIAVYDINAYSFDEILNIFTNNSGCNVHIGTFNINTKIIITPTQILM